MGNQGRWVCLCDCGVEFMAYSGCLRSGDTVSCGCRKLEHIRENFTNHGKASSQVYRIWAGMIQRCSNIGAPSYKLYGGRGITYDPRWERFENFYEDMGDRPEGMSLDRIDVNGNYCKENCRWATAGVQNFNKRQRADNTSGCVGVTLLPTGKWRVRISFENKNIHWGCYPTFEQAVAAREQAELHYYGFNLKEKK